MLSPIISKEKENLKEKEKRKKKNEGSENCLLSTTQSYIVYILIFLFLLVDFVFKF